MPFDWRDFFVDAYLLRDDPAESKRRTAVSRAYYYAYNAALKHSARLTPVPVQGPGGGVHARLWGSLLRQPDPKVKELAIIRGTLHANRIDADYKERTVEAWKARKQIRETRDFELLLADILGETPPPPL